MPAPIFDLSVLGSAPNNYATEAGLEGQINAGFSALYAQSRNAYLSGSVVRLASVAGDGQAVTGAIPAAFADFVLQHGVEFSLIWPAANASASPTLAVTDTLATYTMTLQNWLGGTLRAGELRAGGLYVIRMTSNTTARVQGVLSLDQPAEVAEAVRVSEAQRAKLEALPTGASIAADLADLEAQISALSAASIAGVAGPYATISEGLSAVGNGAQFLVATPGTGRIDLYRRTSDMGYYQMEWTQVRDMATRAGLASAVAAGLTHADGVTITAGGRQYVASAGATAVPGLPGWLPAGVVTLDHFGAVGTGATSDQAAFDAARAYGVPIYLPAGRRYLVTDPASYGVPLVGPGEIVTAVTGGLLDWRQPEDRNPVQYRHFAHAAKNAIIAGTSLKVVVFGDSTATSGYGVAIDTLISDELGNMGVGVASVVLASVAGHSWGSQNLATILTGYAEQKHLALIKFGINDAGASPTTIASAAATMRTAMRQRLAEIRASTYGAAADLSIILIMPNALGNNGSNANNRNNLWLAAIRGVYLEAARDYGCVIYDPYAETQWANGQENRSLDSFLVHPQPNYTLDIWGRALRETLQPFGSVPRNRSVWRRSVEGNAAAPSTAITGFARGVSYVRASSADGWPFSGLLITEFHPDSVGRQTLVDFTNTYGRQITRHWVTAGAAWSAWSGTYSGDAGRVALAKQNSWVDYGGNHGSLSALRAVDGTVRLFGAIKDGTTTATTTIATLPAGYRPIAEMIIPVATLASPYIGQIRITTAGVISLRVAGDATGMFFDGVGFVGAV